MAQGKFSFQQYNALLNSVQLEDFKGVDRPPYFKPQTERLQEKYLAVSLQKHPITGFFHRLMKNDDGSVVLDLPLIIHVMHEYVMADALCPGQQIRI